VGVNARSRHQVVARGASALRATVAGSRRLLRHQVETADTAETDAAGWKIYKPSLLREGLFFSDSFTFFGVVMNCLGNDLFQLKQ
jgi:hypothetical protein